MAKLKMWIGNLDGVREALVIASSKERARKAVPTGRHDFDEYWSPQTEVLEGFEPETLYTRPLRRVKHPWVRGRCPL